MRTITVPFSFSGGAVGTTNDPHQIARQEIINVVMTNQYERVMLPGYGASASKLLYETQDPFYVADFKEEAMSMLNSNLSNCQVMDMSLTRNSPDNSWHGPGDPEVTVHLTVKYKLNGDVTSSTVSVALADPSALNVFTPF